MAAMRSRHSVLVPLLLQLVLLRAPDWPFVDGISSVSSYFTTLMSSTGGNTCAQTSPSETVSSTSRLNCVVSCQAKYNANSTGSPCNYANYRPTAKLCQMFYYYPNVYQYQHDCVHLMRKSSATTCVKGVYPYVPAENCSFPFTYNGSVYYNCIKNVTGVTTSCDQFACRNNSNWSFSLCYNPAVYQAQITNTNTQVPVVGSVPTQSVFGWIIIQNRIDTTTTWYYPWANYKAGFGTLGSNYWFGLERVHQLTALAATYRLRIELQELTTGRWYSCEYASFAVGDETTTKYTLTVSGWIGDDPIGAQPGDLLHSNYNPATESATFGKYHHSGMKFTTSDKQNDKRVNGTNPNCALNTVNSGGWWFNDCYLSDFVLRV